MPESALGSRPADWEVVGDVATSGRYDCVYFKVYVAGGAPALEWLITETLPRVLAIAPLDRWFFLRYWDEGGLHLRLRLWLETARVSSRANVIHALLDDAIADMPAALPVSYRPAVVAHNTATRRVMARSENRVERADYQPEVENYGRDGVTIAERLFAASSETVARILTAERSAECSRKRLTLPLMAAVLESFPSTLGAEGFWRRYADYWLGRNPEQRATWLPRFEAKAEGLIARGVAIPTPADRLSPVASKAVGHWRQALETAAQDFNALGQASLGPTSRLTLDLTSDPTSDLIPSNDELASHFVHLTNNRLGLHHLEEAYFAILLASATRASRQSQ